MIRDLVETRTILGVLRKERFDKILRLTGDRDMCRPSERIALDFAVSTLALSNQN